MHAQWIVGKMALRPGLGLGLRRAPLPFGAPFLAHYATTVPPLRTYAFVDGAWLYHTLNRLMFRRHGAHWQHSYGVDLRRLVPVIEGALGAGFAAGQLGAPHSVAVERVLVYGAAHPEPGAVAPAFLPAGDGDAAGSGDATHGDALRSVPAFFDALGSTELG